MSLDVHCSVATVSIMRSKISSGSSIVDRLNKLSKTGHATKYETPSKFGNWKLWCA